MCELRLHNEIKRWHRLVLPACLLACLGLGLASFGQVAGGSPDQGEAMGVSASSPRLAGRLPSENKLVFIPPNFLDLYPFLFRFVPESETSGHHAIDLKSTRFITDTLEARSEAGQRRFLEPDLSAFLPDLLEGPVGPGKFSYFIVQASSALDQNELRKWLEQSGIPILDYLPQEAYLVRADGPTANFIFQRPEVFWAGLFHPAYRIDPKLDYLIETSPGHEVLLRAIFDGALCPGEELFQASLAATGASIRDIAATESGFIVTLEGSSQVARSLVRLPGCLWVERYVEPRLDNNIARTSTSVTTGRGGVSGPIMDIEDVWARGIRGEGQIASAADTGLSTGTLATLHQDYGNQSDPNNPMRVIKGYGIGRTGIWDDNQTTGGGHGTHTSGSIVGNGFRSGSTPSTNTYPATSYTGAAPKAQFVFQSIMNSSGGLSLPADLNNLFQPPYTDGARVHSNSWGSAVAGDYTTNSQNLDKFCWLNKDMVITFSAGNSGVDTSPSDGIIDMDSIGAPGTAKNCITVGASENYRPTFVYEYPSGDCTGDGFTQQAWGWAWSPSYPSAPIRTDLMANNASGMGAFSSRGPTNDGRIKPDIVAPGIGVVSTRTDLNQAYEEWGVCAIPVALQTYYMTMGGTSMSNPLTAGSAVLVRQYYADGWHANNSLTTNGSAVPADGFNPSSALVKATLINGAWDMAPGQYGTGTTKEIPPGWDTGHDLPNNAEGYGRVDLEHSLFPGSGWGDDASRKLEVHDVSPGLTTGQSNTYTFDVTTNANPLIVTLVWTDPYGGISAGTELVNNLDLTVTAPDTTVYYPNGLNKTSGVDTKNNVEQVKLTSPEAGTYTIRVTGTAIPGNGQAGTTTQPYALAISGVSGCPNNPSSVSVSPSGPLTLCTGVSQALTANLVGGTGPFTYQWTEDSVDIPGANSSTYLASGTGAHSYNCKVTGSGCSLPISDGSPTQISWQDAPAFAGLEAVSNPAASSCTLNLSWSEATSACGGGIYYNVYRSTSSGFTPDTSNRIATGVVATSFSDTAGLVSGTPYYYIVRAVDSGNGVEDSNAVVLSDTPTGSVSSSTPVNQNFATGDPPTGWTRTNGGTGTQQWTTTNPGIRSIPSGMTAPVEIIDSDYDGVGKTQDDSLISPAFDCTGATAVTLTFDTYFNWYSSSDFAYIDVSSNGGGSWQNKATWTSDMGSSTSASHQVMDITALAGTSANVMVRFRYVGAYGWYWLVDNVKVDVTSAVSCAAGGAVKPVPDGSWISGTPIKASKNTGDGSSLTLTWDVSTCVDTDYNAYYGVGSAVSAYTLTGSECTLGNSGSATWDPAPAVPGAETFLWWVIVGSDGIQTESSWGKDSAGTERHPAASAQCGFTAKSTATTCP